QARPGPGGTARRDRGAGCRIAVARRIQTACRSRYSVAGEQPLTASNPPVNEVLLIAGMALVTLAIRYPLLALVGKVSLPEPVLRALKYVPPAVLTAIIVPA